MPLEITAVRLVQINVRKIRNGKSGNDNPETQATSGRRQRTKTHKQSKTRKNEEE